MRLLWHICCLSCYFAISFSVTAESERIDLNDFNSYLIKEDFDQTTLDPYAFLWNHRPAKRTKETLKRFRQPLLNSEDVVTEVLGLATTPKENEGSDRLTKHLPQHMFTHNNHTITPEKVAASNTTIPRESPTSWDCHYKVKDSSLLTEDDTEYGRLRINNTIYRRCFDCCKHADLEKCSQIHLSKCGIGETLPPIEPPSSVKPPASLRPTPTSVTSREPLPSAGPSAPQVPFSPQMPSFSHAPPAPFRPPSPVEPFSSRLPFDPYLQMSPHMPLSPHLPLSPHMPLLSQMPLSPEMPLSLHTPTSLFSQPSQPNLPFEPSHPLQDPLTWHGNMPAPNHELFPLQSSSSYSSFNSVNQHQQWQISEPWQEGH